MMPLVREVVLLALALDIYQTSLQPASRCPLEGLRILQPLVVEAARIHGRSFLVEEH
jgi:hypothetical protein